MSQKIAVMIFIPNCHLALVSTDLATDVVNLMLKCNWAAIFALKNESFSMVCRFGAEKNADVEYISGF